MMFTLSYSTFHIVCQCKQNSATVTDTFFSLLLQATNLGHIWKVSSLTLNCFEANEPEFLHYIIDKFHAVKLILALLQCGGLVIV